MKKCFKCGRLRSLSDFYKHSGMADGHLNKCKDCAKKDVKKQYRINIQNFSWHEKEKARGREKYKRLNYKDIYKIPTNVKREIMERYKEKYPEKLLAKNASQHINNPAGKEKHHWSYNFEHYKDVLFLTTINHNIIHRYMIYDQERMMYRTLSGLLLDTKEEHFKYINQFIT